MPIAQSGVFDLNLSLTVFKAVILLILVFYAIFSLIILRQVDLMSKTLITHVSPVVKAIAIVHAGFILGLIVLVLGAL
ncbi:hypothetical protein A3C26_00610 [Candidatus Daviesbacteria bacterium RIFCSPHIGHO2_02_FULL_39_12]|uniref:Uncharacterized protein n=2 Tax=Candidatus Daviesiibacteriota TaxID=1752718 RepID=A0A1F5J9K8_9BACT|nr:MAG: hypothetical protein A3C26_00610 [Candidatus Daviesbacteria bacterium RIFCSPHIGHO2_02_FULL_39_12]OGE72507.1 MAG: hypothetical protein A3H40_00190 [Candidatus Daviesbacteria bacterium RIFCSPLOWO2_02_FULL_38_15]